MPVPSTLLPKRRTCFKILAVMFLAGALTATAAIIIVPHLLNLETYRPQILSAAQKNLHRPFSYEAASFSWQLTPTVVVKGITIADQSGTGTLLKIERLTFSLALLPLLHKELRLREIVADRPVLVFDRNREGMYSIADLFTGTPSGFKTSLETIRIRNGMVRFTDRQIDPAGLTTSLQNLDLTVSGFSRGETSRFTISAQVPDGNRPSSVTLSGTVHIPESGHPLDTVHIDVSLSAKEFNAERYWPYYGRNLPFERVGGLLDVEQEFKGTPLQFRAKGQVRVRGLRFTYPRAFAAPLTPRDVRLAYELERTPRDLSLKTFDLDVDGLRVKGSCGLGDINSNDMRIKTRVATSPFRLEEFNRYIPYGIIPTGTGDFIRQHITGGIFRLDEGSLDGRMSQITHMERGDNSNVLSIRASVEKGLVSLGSQVPVFSDIKGGLEIRGKDFSLRGMSGRFGASPFRLEGKIAGYPLTTPASYPFSMTITPSKAEVDWLLRQKDPAVIPFSGPSTLTLTGSGTASDYRLSGAWDLSGADYRYRENLHKPAGISNQLRFSTRLGNGRTELTDFSYQLPPLEISATAVYRYNDRTPLSFTLATNRFMMNRDLPYLPGLQKYHPAGSLQVRLSGSGDPNQPESIRLNGDVTLTDVSLTPHKQVKPLSGINGKILLTETTLEAKALTGRIGTSSFTATGRVAGRTTPAVELAFTAPVLHLEDFGFVSSVNSPDVKNLSGAVALKDSNLTIRHLSGQAGGTKFNASGEVLNSGSPSLNLRVDFPFLNVEELLALAHLKQSGNQAAQPGKVALKARITSAAGKFRETPFQQLATELTLNNDLLAIQSLGVGLFGGNVSASGQVDLAGRGGPTYQVRYRLEQLAADRLLHAAGMQPHIRGKLDAEGELTARGTTGEELTKSVQAQARVHLRQGDLSLHATGESMGQQTPYSYLDADLGLKGEILTVQGLKAGIFDGVISGSGQVDLAAKAGPAYQARYRLEHVATDQLLLAAGAKPYLSGRLTSDGELTARGNTREELNNSRQMTADILLTDGMLNNPVIFGSMDTSAFPFKKIQTRLTLNGRKLDLGSILMDVFSGVVTGKVDADFSAPEGPAYHVSCRLADIDAAALFRAFDVTKELSGRMSSQAELSARGEGAEALRKTVTGTYSTRLEKGVIKKYGFVSKVFSILNVSHIIDFRMSDLTSFGMPYDEIHGDFVFDNGTVTTSDLSIHSTSLNMTMVGNADLVTRQLDVKIGVQPFQTFGKVISRIPIVGWILTGGKKRVVVVYYEAKGPFGDPTISGTSLESLPGGIYNIFKRIYGLPEGLISQPGEVLMGN